MNLGKNIIQDIQPFVDVILADAADHANWPSFAKFKISFRLDVDGRGFGKTQHQYFSSAEEVSWWESDRANRDRVKADYTVYEWDNGPRVIKHNWF